MFTIGCHYLLLYHHLILTTSLLSTVCPASSRLSALPLRAFIVHYVSSTAEPEDIDFCSLGGRLHRLSALRQENVDGEVRPQSARPITVSEHGERERGE